MVNKNLKGFTLIELLVVTAVIGVLAVVSATIFNTIFKSQNKTAVINEARQNGDLAIDKFERDIKQAVNITEDTLIPNEITVNVDLVDGTAVTWKCVDNSGIGEITRNGLSVLNQDSTSGIMLVTIPSNTCVFDVGPVGESQLVTWTFDLTQRRDPTNLPAEFEIEVPFQTSVGTRAYK